MRLVRFEDESGGFAVDLHPLITVISGMPAHVRERLVHGIAALPRGTDPGGRGALEVHGVFLDLNRESLDLLELDQDLDVVLRPSDLPGSELLGDEVADEPVVDHGVVDDEVREARRLVQVHDDEYEEALRSVEVYRNELVELEEEQATLTRQLSDVRMELDSFAAAGLQLAREELDEALKPVGAVVAEPAPTGSDPAPAAPESAPSAPEFDVAAVEADRERIEARLSYLIEESDRLKRMLRSLRAIDPEPVRSAYEVLAGTAVATAASPVEELVESTPVEDPADAQAPTTMTVLIDVVESVPSPEAEALADEWEHLTARLDSTGHRPDPSRERLDALTALRDDAFDAMKAAERALRAPELDPTIVDRLETVHDEIFELDGRTSRFGAGKIRRRLDALRTEESTLLGTLGFDSWSAYIMGITSAGSDPARRRDHEHAVRAYEQAEVELERAAREHRDDAPAVDPEHADLIAARDDLRYRIEGLLGGDVDDDPVPALRAVRVEVTRVVEEVRTAPAAPAVAETTEIHEPAGTTEPAGEPDPAAVAALRDALAGTGAALPDRELSPRELRSLAAGWLETMEELPARIADASDIRDAIEAEISELAVELEALPDVSQPTGPSPAGTAPAAPAPASASDPERVAEARRRVADAEARVRAHEEAVARIGDLSARHERLVEQAQRVDSILSDREPMLAGLLEQRVTARNRLRRAESQRSTVESARWDRPQPGQNRFTGGSANAEAVEWYVLARLAQQRSVSFVGSVPLLIDDAFANWPVAELHDVFTRLERMGEVIQIVYLTDDPDVGAWARGLGSERALVLDMRVAS